jgi:futalosine hydrolase
MSALPAEPERALGPAPDVPRPNVPQPSVLVLVPTELELRRLAALGGFGAAGRPEPAVELVGFGALAAAARTMALALTHRPRRFVLVGIAGSYGARGAAAETFRAVRVDGLGAGEGRRHLLPSELGFPQWRDQRGAVHEELPLVGSGGVLLTVMAAARDADEVAGRLARHPGALGEDMEAFGVALAAHLAGVPLTVVRGWSNVAGDRDVRAWDVDGALAAARSLALEVLAEVQP